MHRPSSKSCSQARARRWRATTRGALVRGVVALGAVSVVACGAIDGARERLAPSKTATAPAAAEQDPLPGALVELLPHAVRRRGANELVFEVDSFVVALARARLQAGESPVPIAARDDDYVLLDSEGSSATLAKQLGLEPGDVLQSVNGVDLRAAPGEARALLDALDGGASLEVERDGVTITIEYLFVDGLAWAQARGVTPPGVGVGAGAADEVPDLSVELEPEPDPFALAEARAAERAGGRPSARGSGARPSSSPAGSTSGGERPATRPGSKAGAGGSGGAGGNSGGKSRTTATCASATSCTISRSEFNRYLNNPASLASEASVSNVGRGYKLSGVRAGGPLDRLGMKSGDVITSVNGYQIADDADAMALYFGLGSTSTFLVRYLRNGRAQSKTIRLR